MDFGEQYPYYAARLMKQSWACSSVGRAPALQAGGPEFESLQVHHDFPVCPLLFFRTLAGGLAVPFR